MTTYHKSSEMKQTNLANWPVSPKLIMLRGPWWHMPLWKWHMPLIAVQRPRSSRITTVTTAPKLLLTAVEAAERLGISRTKVYELMAAGTLRSIHIGRLRRVPADALRDFIEAMELA